LATRDDVGGNTADALGLQVREPVDGVSVSKPVSTAGENTCSPACQHARGCCNRTRFTDWYCRCSTEQVAAIEAGTMTIDDVLEARNPVDVSPVPEPALTAGETACWRECMRVKGCCIRGKHSDRVCICSTEQLAAIEAGTMTVWDVLVARGSVDVSLAPESALLARDLDVSPVLHPVSEPKEANHNDEVLQVSQPEISLESGIDANRCGDKCPKHCCRRRFHKWQCRSKCGRDDVLQAQQLETSPVPEVESAGACDPKCPIGCCLRHKLEWKCYWQCNQDNALQARQPEISPVPDVGVVGACDPKCPIGCCHRHKLGWKCHWQCNQKNALQNRQPETSPVPDVDVAGRCDPKCPRGCCRLFGFKWKCHWMCGGLDDALQARQADTSPALEPVEVSETQACVNCPRDCCWRGVEGRWRCRCRKEDVAAHVEARHPDTSPVPEPIVASQKTGPCDSRCRKYRCCQGDYCTCTAQQLDSLEVSELAAQAVGA
jgi:hypothetical protein